MHHWTGGQLWPRMVSNNLFSKITQKGKNDPTFSNVLNFPSIQYFLRVYKLFRKCKGGGLGRHQDAQKGTLTAVKHIPNLQGSKTLIMARQIHMYQEGDGLMPSGLYHVRKRPVLARVRFSAEAFPQLDTWIMYDKQYVAMEHVQGINLKMEFGISASQLQTFWWTYPKTVQFRLTVTSRLGNATCANCPSSLVMWYSSSNIYNSIPIFFCCIIKGSTMETRSSNDLLFNIWQQWSVY